MFVVWQDRKVVREFKGAEIVEVRPLPRVEDEEAVVGKTTYAILEAEDKRIMAEYTDKAQTDAAFGKMVTAACCGDQMHFLAIEKVGGAK